MNLDDIAKILYRRRWIVGVVLGLTAGGAIYTATSATPEYESIAALLLATPEIVGSELSAPEAADASSSLSPAVITEIADGDAVRFRISRDFPSIDYTTTLTRDSIIRVETSSETDADVVEAADAIISEILSIVERLDEDDDSRTATVEILSQPRLARQRTIVIPDDEPETEFYASGSVLLSIETDVEPPRANPYNASMGTLRVLAEVASTTLVRESIVESNGDSEADVEIVFESRDVAPIMYVVARASTPGSTRETLDTALRFLDDDIEARQEVTGADPSTFLQYQRLAVTEPEDASGNLRRPLAIVFVLGVIAAASLAVLVDSALQLRDERRFLDGRSSSDVAGRRIRGDQEHREDQDYAGSREAN